MEYTREQKIAIIENVLKENGLNFSDLYPLFNKEMISSSEVKKDETSSGISYDRVSSFFSPKMEEVDIRNIVGLEYKSGSFYDCLLNIYRPESIFENLGNFDYEKFHKTLKNSNFQLIEKDGEYYVNGDGNHRVLLMIFQLHMQLARLVKLRAPEWMIHKLLNQSKITVPVIHLNHKENLLKFLDTYSLSPLGAFEQDFINSFLDGKNYRDIVYDKESNTYSINYKGIKRNELTSNEALEIMSSIENIDVKNNIFDNDEGFILFNEHFGLIDIPKEEIKRCDKIISNINLPKTKFPYFLEGSYWSEKYSLHIGNCSYTDEISNIKEINNFIENNLNILKANDVRDVYEQHTSLYERNYDNITFGEAQKIIDTLNKLESLIIKNEAQRSTKK